MLAKVFLWESKSEKDCQKWRTQSWQVKIIVKTFLAWPCRAYLICPNPQTCDDAFEWVEKRESDEEREMTRGKRGSEGNKAKVEKELEAEEVNQDSKGFVLPPCDLFNDERGSLVDTSPSLTEVSHILSWSKVSRLLPGFEASLSQVILAAKCHQNSPGHLHSFSPGLELLHVLRGAWVEIIHLVI